MRSIPSDPNSIDRSGGLDVWLQENRGDNGIQLERMRRNLRQAREHELTPCQRQTLLLYYEQHMSVSQIARQLEVNPSTVTRTLQRAQERLWRCLQYTL